jgi:hypothetical protein
MTVINVDGPPVVHVRANEVVIATVACGATAVVSLGQPHTPPLPWAVSVVTPGGQELGTFDQSEDDFKPFVTIRDTEVFPGDTGGVGPAPIGTPCTGSLD